jgi:hypothetical protein
MIAVYPNPSTGNTVVSTKGKAGKIIISTPAGAIVETIEAVNGQDKYELNILNKGIYIVSFISDNLISTEKLVVN